MRQSGKQTQTAKFAIIVSMALATTLFSGCAMFSPRTAVPISNITDAAESGQSSTMILTAMKSARTTYALRGSDFAKLAERDVPEPVLDELQQRFFGDVDWLTRRWVTERRFSCLSSLPPGGWSPPCPLSKGWKFGRPGRGIR